jgi:hypothetical protein
MGHLLVRWEVIQGYHISCTSVELFEHDFGTVVWQIQDFCVGSGRMGHTEHHKTPPTHSRPNTIQTTYCEGTRSSQGFTARLSLIENFINFNKSVLTVLITSVTHTRQHACNICVWSISFEVLFISRWYPSLAETCKGLILLLKSLLRLMEFSPNFTI